VQTFESFFRTAEPRLRRALGAAYGGAVGREAAIEALAWAWEHWDRVCGLDNPIGYLYRVGQSEAKRLRRRPRAGPVERPAAAHAPDVEPGLAAALAGLSEQQRVIVVLVHGFDWTHQEVAELLGISRSSVQTHVERGMRHLRSSLEVSAGG
jgi:RNA polymerase sigma-70 factor (ECF subfamily)